VVKQPEKVLKMQVKKLVLNYKKPQKIPVPRQLPNRLKNKYKVLVNKLSKVLNKLVNKLNKVLNELVNKPNKVLSKLVRD